MLLLEHWKPVVGFEGFYAISNTGRVERSKGGCGCKARRVLKPYLTRDGYFQVALSVHGVTSKHQVHRLVAIAFIGQPPHDQPEVAHWNGFGIDNRVSNLRWATTKENAHDRFRHGTVLRGDQLPYKSPVDPSLVLEIRRLREAGEALAVIARSVKMTRHQTRLIARGEARRDVPI